MEIAKFSNSDVIGEKFYMNNEENTHVIQKMPPLSPAKWTGTPVYKKITKIHMSCHDKQWFDYVERMHPDLNQKFITAKRLNGKEISINTSNIVSTEDFTLVEATYHTENQCFGCGDYKITGLIEDWEKVELIDID